MKKKANASTRAEYYKKLVKKKEEHIAELQLNAEKIIKDIDNILYRWKTAEEKEKWEEIRRKVEELRNKGEEGEE